jgi:uncharacterized phiE125 gp8 family phage protein
MPLILQTPPAEEPVSLAEAKLHLRLEDAAEDDALAALIAAARLHIERSFALALISQLWKLRLDDWPGDGRIALPLWPARAIGSLKVFGEDGEAMTIDAAHYVADLGARPPQLLLRRDRAWPRPGRRAGGIEIGFDAGFGSAAADVPAPIRQAIKLHVAHLYENRDGAGSQALPAAAAALMSPYREVRL